MIFDAIPVFMQIFVPWMPMLVSTPDPHNDWSNRKPLWPMLLDKKIVQPQDLVVTNIGSWYPSFFMDIYKVHLQR